MKTVRYKKILATVCLFTLPINLNGMDQDRLSWVRNSLARISTVFRRSPAYRNLAEETPATPQSAGSAGQQQSPPAQPMRRLPTYEDTLNDYTQPPSTYSRQSINELRPAPPAYNQQPTQPSTPRRVPPAPVRTLSQQIAYNNLNARERAAADRMFMCQSETPIRVFDLGGPALPDRTRPAFSNYNAALARERRAAAAAVYERIINCIERTSPNALNDAITMEYLFNRLLPNDHTFELVVPYIMDTLNDVQSNVPPSLNFALTLLAVRRGYSFKVLQEDNEMVKSSWRIGVEKMILFQAYSLSDPVPDDDPDRERNLALQYRLREHIMKDRL